MTIEVQMNTDRNKVSVTITFEANAVHDPIIWSGIQRAWADLTGLLIQGTNPPQPESAPAVASGKTYRQADPEKEVRDFAWASKQLLKGFPVRHKSWLTSNFIQYFDDVRVSDDRLQVGGSLYAVRMNIRGRYTKEGADGVQRYTPFLINVDGADDDHKRVLDFLCIDPELMDGGWSVFEKEAANKS